MTRLSLTHKTFTRGDIKSHWVLRSHVACSFRNITESRAEVEIWREGVKSCYNVEIREYDVDERGPFSSISANTGGTAGLLTSANGCAVFAIPESNSPQSLLSSNSLVHGGNIRCAQWHPLSDIHVGLLYDNRWELINFTSQQSIAAPEQNISIDATEFNFAERNVGKILVAFQVFFLEKSAISVHRCVPSQVLLPMHLVKQCSTHAWLAKPELVAEDFALLHTTSFPPENTVHALPEGPPATHFIVLTGHPIVVLAVARQNGTVEVITLESGPALLCDRIEDLGDTVKLHCIGPSAKFVVVQPRHFVCSMSLPWVEIMQQGQRVEGTKTSIKTLLEGDVLHWTSLTSSRGMCFLEGESVFRMVNSGEESVALIPYDHSDRDLQSGSLQCQHYAQPMMIPPNNFFGTEHTATSLSHSLTNVKGGFLTELESRQLFMKKYVRELHQTTQKNKEYWDNLVMKIEAASVAHKRNVEIMEGVLERDAKMEKDADVLIAQLEKYMKVTRVENVSSDVTRLEAKIGGLKMRLQSFLGKEEEEDVRMLM